MGGMASWYKRNKQAPLIGSPSAWTIYGPTSDNTRSSTTVTAAAAPVEIGDGGGARSKGGENRDVTEECWSMYDQVGELRYVSNAIAGRMGQAVLYVERDGERVDDSEDDDPLLKIITNQMIERMGLNIFVAGSVYLVGLPIEDTDAFTRSTIQPDGGVAMQSNTVWLVVSSLEFKKKNKKIEIRGKEYEADKIYFERIWDPHPAVYEQADSPVISALPVLRELVGLTQHVSAQIDSRLAGAGVYWIPNSILQNGKAPDSASGSGGQYNQNAILNAIMKSMIEPIEDRSNASSFVPVLIGAPDDSIANIRYDTFSTPFDKESKALREEAIRRLGLNLDAPPELLQGMGDANHWGMWLVRDEVIQAHVAPRLDLIADALTYGFYRPIKKQQGDPDPSSYTLKFDTSGLVQRPNRLQDAAMLHAVGAVGDKALREAANFDESDAPNKQERAQAIALSVAQANPQLLDNMPEIVEAVMALLDGTPETGAEEISSQRDPGTLKPTVPGRPARAPRVNPNGSPIKRTTIPVEEAEGTPANGNPVR